MVEGDNTRKKRKRRPNGFHVPTPETRSTVSALISFGITHEEVAKYLDITTSTLAREYRREIDTAQTRANAAIAAKLYKNANDNNSLAAQIFWLKTRAKWREKEREIDPRDQAVSLAEKILERFDERERRTKSGKSDDK